MIIFYTVYVTFGCLTTCLYFINTTFKEDFPTTFNYIIIVRGVVSLLCHLYIHVQFGVLLKHFIGLKQQMTKTLSLDNIAFLFITIFIWGLNLICSGIAVLFSVSLLKNVQWNDSLTF